MTETKNKKAGDITKTQGNEYNNQRKVTIYKRRQFEIVEVDKQIIDNIKNVIDGSKNNVNKGVISCDVILGFSTTLLGSFLGFIPSIMDMVRKKEITWVIILYVSLLFIAIILFVVYLSVKRKKCADIDALVLQISQNIDTVSNNLILPDNDIPENIPVNSLSGTSKQTD